MRFSGTLKTILNFYLSTIGIRRFPYSIFWLITWQCNSRCLHCEWGKAVDELLRLPECSQDLALARVKEILTEARSSGARHIAFAGGEPFLRKDFLEILKHCKKEGYAVTVSTNGFLLANFEFAQQVIATGVDRIDLSLDAAGTLHDKLRDREGAFRMIEAAIDNLKKLKRQRNFYLGFNTVVSAFNMQSLLELFEYAQLKGIDGVGLQPFHYIQARAKGLIPCFVIAKEQLPILKETLNTIIRRYSFLLSNSTFFIRNIATFYENNKMPGYACYAGLQEIHLYPDGAVSPCCFIQSKESVRDKSLKQILGSREFRQLVKKARHKECSGCWSPPVHEYNLLLKPQEFLSGLKLIRTFLKWSRG